MAKYSRDDHGIQRMPALMFQPDTPRDRVVAISCGLDHVLLLSADGSVRSFGCAEKGRLGRLAEADADIAIGDLDAAARPAAMRRVLLPTHVPGLADVTSISAVRTRRARLRCVVAHVR